jgi:hypothetical protein
MHRVAVIIETIRATLETALGREVLAHHFLSLEDALEIPATIVNVGEDTTDEAGDFGQMASLLEVEITLVEAGPDGPSAMAALFEQRAIIHQALAADPTLGLAYVLRIAPVAANKPTPATGGERIAVAQVFRWAVLYTHPLTDPET